MEQFSEPTFVTSAEEIAEICRFRVAVWAATGTLRSDAFGQDGWRDPVDDDAFHWIIRHSITAQKSSERRAA